MKDVNKDTKVVEKTAVKKEAVKSKQAEAPVKPVEAKAELVKAKEVVAPPAVPETVREPMYQAKEKKRLSNNLLSRARQAK